MRRSTSCRRQVSRTFGTPLRSFSPVSSTRLSRSGIGSTTVSTSKRMRRPRRSSRRARRYASACGVPASARADRAAVIGSCGRPAHRLVDLAGILERRVGLAEEAGDEPGIALQHLGAALLLGRRREGAADPAAAAQHRPAAIVARVEELGDPVAALEQEVSQADARVIHEVAPHEVVAVADPAGGEQHARVLDAAGREDEGFRRHPEGSALGQHLDGEYAVGRGVGLEPGDRRVGQDGQGLGAGELVAIDAAEGRRRAHVEEDGAQVVAAEPGGAAEVGIEGVGQHRVARGFRKLEQPRRLGVVGGEVAPSDRPAGPPTQGRAAKSEEQGGRVQPPQQFELPPSIRARVPVRL